MPKKCIIVWCFDLILFCLLLLTKCVVIFVFCPYLVIYLFCVAHKELDSFVVCPYFVMFVVVEKVCNGFVF